MDQVLHVVDINKSLPRNLFQVKIRARFSFGADPEWSMIRTAIIQTGFSPGGTRSSTRLDLVRF